MNSSKSLLLLSLFSCTLVELLNSGLTQANELATKSVNAPSQTLYRPIAKTTDANSTEDADPQDLRLISNAPINTILNPDASDLALAKRKKRITKPSQKKKGTTNTQTQIQNPPIDTPAPVPTEQPQTQIQNPPINTPAQVPTEQPQTQIQTPPLNTQPPMPSSVTATQNQIQYKRNDVSLAVQFGNSTSFGVQGKIGLGDNISIRPEVFFGSGGNVENKQTTFGIPSNDSLSTFVNNNNNSFTLPSAVTLNAPITSPSTFTTNIAVSSNGTTIPAGTVIPSGTTIPAGTVLPAGLVIPALTLLPGGTSYAPGFLKSKPTGTAFGLAITYDLKLDPQGKSTAYIGPKVAFSSASGALTFGGVENPNVTLNTNETKIGLVAGADYAVSDNFTVGANVTYNISRSLNGSVSIGGNSLTDFIQSSGSSTDFGIRLGYQF